MRPGWGKGETGLFGKCRPFPRAPAAPAGAGPAPHQHRVVCAPSAGPAAAPHAGRGQKGTDPPRVPPPTTPRERRQRPGHSSREGGASPALLLERREAQPELEEDGSLHPPASPASRRSREKKGRLCHFPKIYIAMDLGRRVAAQNRWASTWRKRAEERMCKVTPRLTRVSPPSFGGWTQSQWR